MTLVTLCVVVPCATRGAALAVVLDQPYRLLAGCAAVLVWGCFLWFVGHRYDTRRVSARSTEGRAFAAGVRWAIAIAMSFVLLLLGAYFVRLLGVPIGRAVEVGFVYSGLLAPTVPLCLGAIRLAATKRPKEPQ